MNIYVGNLSFGTTENDLRELFGKLGDVEDVSIIMDRGTGRSRGFGFVVMSDDAQSLEAIEKLNGHELDGRPLTVNEARGKSRPAHGE